jgi:NhaP-type Na+/H+ or K+/H+ antiporter
LLLAAAFAMIIRSLAAARLDRWNLGAPVVMVLAGVLVGLLNENSIAAVLNTEAVQHAAEIILAVLLFVDATEVRGGRLWGGYPRLVTRVLLVAMPVSLALAALLGWLLAGGALLRRGAHRGPRGTGAPVPGRVEVVRA